ncbi:ribonuclease H-like domain-containing protein [Tanacetum coccineum]
MPQRCQNEIAFVPDGENGSDSDYQSENSYHNLHSSDDEHDFKSDFNVHSNMKNSPTMKVHQRFSDMVVLEIKENTNSWEWFLKLLKKAIGTPNGLVISSDMQKGLGAAITQVYPDVEHRECMRHMYSNFKKQFRGDFFKFNIWGAANTYNPNHEVKREIHVTWAFTGNTKCGDGVADFKRRRRDFQSDGVMDLTTALGRSRIKVALEDTTWRQVANLKAQAKRLFENENVWVEMHRGIAWDKVENTDPQSTPQVLLLFKKYTLPVTYLEEVEETLGTSIEVPSFDGPEPQPQHLPNCPPLDVSLGSKRGLKPPIESHSLDSFRMKVIFDKKKLESS